MNRAAPVDFDGQACGLPTNSTVAWTTLRVAHTIHKSAATVRFAKSKATTDQIP